MLKRNPKNVRFNKLCQAAEAFGFEFKGGRGSHRIYTKKGIKEMLNFQNIHGKAKPYHINHLFTTHPSADDLCVRVIEC